MRVVILSLMLSSSAAYAVDISTCGQIIDAGQVGEVLADLDCTAFSNSPAVTLEPGSTLYLNGHAVAGGHLGVLTDPGKKGGPLTRIQGPGEITGMTSCAIWTQNKLSVSDLDLHGNRCGIMTVYNYPLTLEDVSITDNGGDGISFVDVLGNGRVEGEGVTITGNAGDGILTTGKIRLVDAVVRDNAGAGLESLLKAIRVLRGTIVHNQDDDIVSFRRSKLFESTCTHSRDLRNGGTFGICTLD
jgi:hypothetical protein